MAVSCDAASLAAAAKCYTCYTPQQREAVKVYLAAVVAGLDNLTPAELMARAKCYVCLTPGQIKALRNYLICQAANSA